MTPMSLQVASAQLRGQPETASFTLAGVHDPHMNFSSLMPSPVESCVPKRHHSEPTQVFTVRKPFGIGRTRHHAGRIEIRPDGRQVFFLHAKQIDALAACTLHGGNLNLSATSAMARSSLALVMPPHMRGTTE